MEMYVPRDQKYWVDGGEVGAYTERTGVFVDDRTGPSFVDGSAWIDVTMHLLDQSGQLNADELCRVRDALMAELPHGQPSDRVNPTGRPEDEESLFRDIDTQDEFDVLLDDLLKDISNTTTSGTWEDTISTNSDGTPIEFESDTDDDPDPTGPAQ